MLDQPAVTDTVHFQSSEEDVLVGPVVIHVMTVVLIAIKVNFQCEMTMMVMAHETTNFQSMQI